MGHEYSKNDRTIEKYAIYFYFEGHIPLSPSSRDPVWNLPYSQLCLRSLYYKLALIQLVDIIMFIKYQRLVLALN